MRGTRRAREWRTRQTDAEAKLGWRLRDRRLGGFKFRRQYAIEGYIVDFICLEAQLIVELDGGQHVYQRMYDRARTRRLARFGLVILRYWNDEVLRDLDGVCAHILAALTAPHPGPLPASGERV